MDIPSYIIKPHTLRTVVPHILGTIGLTIIFYFGIAINISLLGLSIPSSVKMLIFSVLILLVIVEALLTYVQSAKIEYAIYQNRVQINGVKPSYIMFSATQSITMKKNFFDKVFSTGTIEINATKLIGIEKPDEMLAYINQMVAYSRTQYAQIQ